MSVLRPDTLKLLAGVKPCAPLFSNQILAELFDAEHTRGDLKLLPCTAGGYVVFDTTAPTGRGVVEGPIAKLEDAHAALERLAAPDCKRIRRKRAA